MKVVAVNTGIREAHGWKTIHEFYGWGGGVLKYELFEDLEEDGRKMLI
jgi:hypothetical protein